MVGCPKRVVMAGLVLADGEQLVLLGSLERLDGSGLRGRERGRVRVVGVRIG